MKTYDPAALRTLISRRQPGHSLNGAFYTDDDVFAADMALIFARHWICVGVEPDVPEAGDVRVIDIGDWSVLIVRDDDNQVRAYHNVCRHRGARLLAGPQAVVGNLVCPYHAWTYGLDGRLIHAGHMDQAFDPSSHGLLPVHLRSVGGLLFICLSDDPPADIEALAADMEPYLRPHDLANARVAHEVDIIEPGNWKLTMENNRECYHCAGNHPELSMAFVALNFGHDPASLSDAERVDVEQYDTRLRQAQSEWEAEGLPSALVEHLDNRITGFRTERLLIDGHGESPTLDTRAACRQLLGRFDNPRKGGLTFWTQPNSWHHFMGDHVVSFSVIPIDAGHTLVRTK